MSESLAAAEKLAADGIDAKVINIHTIKPIDEELIVAAAKETGKVVTVEEHSVIGGLGSAVCDVLSEKLPTPVLKIGVMDTFGESGPAVELIKKYGLDADSICEKSKSICKIIKGILRIYNKNARTGVNRDWHFVMDESS